MPNDIPNQPPEIDLDSICILVPKTKDGDTAARAQLLEQVQSYLGMMADRHMDKSLQQKIGPSDVVQQTLTQVIQHFDEFRGETTAEFRGWLKAIVVNEVGKMRRTFRAQKRDVGREQTIDADVSATNAAPVPIDTCLTPSSEAMAAEQIENFHQILAQLPADYAAVIRLRSIEGLPFKEIAKKLDRTHDSVTKLWYRAVLKFEELLRASGDFTSQS